MNVRKASRPPPIHRIVEVRSGGTVIAACGHWFDLNATDRETTDEVTCKSCLAYLQGSQIAKEKAVRDG